MHEVATQPQIRLSYVEEMVEHAGPLFEEHWKEIARNKHLCVLAPDWDKYRRMEQQGLLFALGAWDGSTLVGYSATFVLGNLHYRDLVYAQNDVLFVAKSVRHSRLGLRLIHDTEAEAARRGAKLMLWHTKEGTRMDLLMPHLGYAVQDITYCKEL